MNVVVPTRRPGRAVFCRRLVCGPGVEGREGREARVADAFEKACNKRGKSAT